ncbi:MAG: hypothetical protein D6744_13895, partial [Planctomycetota bacterium]
QGALLGLNQSVIGFGRAFGYVVGGGLYSLWGPSGPYAAAALIVLAGGAALCVVPARLDSAKTSAEPPGDEAAGAVDAR